MKLVYIANIRIPTEKAHGLQIMKMCEAFSAAGTDVELVVSYRRNVKLQRHNPFDYYRVSHIFKIKKVFSFDPIFLLKFPVGIYIKIQSSFFMAGLGLYLAFKKGEKKCILYTRDEYLLPFIQRFSRRVVWEAHNIPRNIKLYKRYWRECHKIVVISNGLKLDLIKLGITADKIIVAPDGVDLKEFDISFPDQKLLRRELSLPIDKKLILYAGHLYDWKGAQTLADAADHLSPDYAIVFVGGTDNDINQFKVKNSHRKNIFVLGRVEHSRIPFYLKAADVLVLPNSGEKDISKLYTSPMKLFEYMAAEKPIVASDLPSIREILTEDNSVLVMPDNALALAKGIDQVLSDGLLARRISNQAFEDVQSYTWQKRTSKIINFIDFSK